MRLPDRFSSDYISGVNAFIDFACQHNSGNDKMRCHCETCMNISQQSVSQV